MPFVTIEVRRSWSADEEAAIIAAVHAALVHAFRISEDDKHVRLVEHAPHRFAAPAALSQPEFHTLVSIDCLPGRSIDTKRLLYDDIVERLEPLGIPRDHVSTLIRESGEPNWKTNGGRAAA